MAKSAILISICILVVEVHSINVLISGATGRTGSLLYRRLQQTNGSAITLRALVRNVDKARAVLNCSKCDASDGIYVGDITKLETLKAAMIDVDALAICTASSYKGVPPNVSYPVGAAPIDIDWHGARNQITALAEASRGKGRVVLVSSLGTTNPISFDGKYNYNFYKLNAEAFLMASGIAFTIIKPCFLSDAEGAKKQLVVGHDDSIKPVLGKSDISRADVARVAMLGLDGNDEDAALSKDLRFDLCSQDGVPPITPDELREVLRAARWNWDMRTASTVLA